MDETYMRRALAQARKGMGRVSPNPMVGAVVVKGGKIAGMGYHRRAGTPHAEVHALAEAGTKARNADLYEPPPALMPLLPDGSRRWSSA